MARSPDRHPGQCQMSSKASAKKENLSMDILSALGDCGPVMWTPLRQVEKQLLRRNIGWRREKREGCKLASSQCIVAGLEPKERRL